MTNIFLKFRPQAKPITEEVNQALAVSINIISLNGSYPLLFYLVTLHTRLALSLAGVPVGVPLLLQHWMMMITMHLCNALSTGKFPNALYNIVGDLTQTALRSYNC